MRGQNAEISARVRFTMILDARGAVQGAATGEKGIGFYGMAAEIAELKGAPERIEEALRHWVRNSSLNVHLFHVGAG
jgi:hypothetical protein